MKRLAIILAAAVSAFGLASPAGAISIGLQPNASIISVGGNASVDIVISGLGAFSAPSLGAFSMELAYDPAIVTPNSALFGSFLDLGNFGSVQVFDLTSSGLIKLDEISLETPADLNASQPGTFTLATLGFTGVAPGVSPITFTLVDLSDESGSSLNANAANGSITVTGASVPDVTSTLGLLLLGCLSLCAVRWCPAVLRKSV